MEHIEELLVKQIDPIKKAQFFGAIFDKAPTFADLQSGTQKTPLFTGVNPLFALANNSYTSFGELSGIPVEHYFASLLLLSTRLEKLGIVDIDDEMTYLETVEAQNV